ncbi:MAG: tetratricopeptide repeat protein [Desulfobacter sp.]|nr:MAG: tetratricopeptide repeat protein [Desulfobacter sp.]
MADQGVSNERKKELEQMDPFQDALVKGLSYASEHKKQIGLIIGAVVVVCVVFSTIIYSFKRSEVQASRLSAKAVAAYGNVYAQDRNPQKGFEAVKDDFQAVLDEYANTSAGRMAMVTFAKICFDAGEYDKAYELYSQALSDMGDDAGMENFFLSALGNLSQLKKDREKAKSYYLRIENGASNLLKDEARFALALIYEAENDMAASLKMYEKIVKENENSIYKAIAQSRINGEKG